MGPWPALVSPCFRENVVATCKMGSFLCSLDHLLKKKRNCLLFWKSNFRMALNNIWKKGYFRPSYKNSFSTYLTHIHTHILLTLLTFFAFTVLKKYDFNRHGFSLVWFLEMILIRAILEQITKWWAKFKLKCLLLICAYTNAIVICKPRTLIDGGEDSVKYRNRKKHCFFAAAILLFIGKTIITW